MTKMTQCDEKKKPTEELPEKSFRYRESLLTDLLNQNEHVRSFKNLIWSVLAIYLLNHIICDLYFRQTFVDDVLELISLFEGSLNVLGTCWLPMLVSTIFVKYYAFRLWASCRGWMSKRAVLVDAVFVLFAVVYIVAFVIIPLKQLTGLPFCTRALIIPEQLRMLLKGYAFVRSNVPKVIWKAETEEKNDMNIIPEFSKYVYFVFAPTLVYKDKYPRVDNINWNFVLTLCFELIAVFWALFHIAEDFGRPYYINVDVKRLNVPYIIYIYLGSFFHSGAIIFIAFYGLLHLWMNLWSELLGFGDRRFYSNWWCATSIPEYLRGWNTLVQDWIYTYLYRDLNKLFRKNRPLTLFFTLFFSSLVHDYLYSAISAYVIPVFNFIYGIAMISIYIPMPKNGWSNAQVIGCKAGMVGILLTFVTLELYSTNVYNCPQNNNPSAFSLQISNCLQ